jgi:hypothetical protein
MAAAEVKHGIPLGHAPHAMLAVLILLCVLGFGTLLVGCTPEDRGGNNALDSTRSAQAKRSTTTRSAQETTARLADEASKAKPPLNVAEAAAAGLIASGLGALRLVVRRGTS